MNVGSNENRKAIMNKIVDLKVTWKKKTTFLICFLMFQIVCLVNDYQIFTKRIFPAILDDFFVIISILLMFRIYWRLLGFKKMQRLREIKSEQDIEIQAQNLKLYLNSKSRMLFESVMISGASSFYLVNGDWMRSMFLVMIDSLAMMPSFPSEKEFIELELDGDDIILI